MFGGHWSWTQRFEKYLPEPLLLVEAGEQSLFVVRCARGSSTGTEIEMDAETMGEAAARRSLAFSQFLLSRMSGRRLHAGGRYAEITFRIRSLLRNLIYIPL